MHIGGQEWQQLQARTAPDPSLRPPEGRALAGLYHRLRDGTPDAGTRAEAARFLEDEIARLDPDAAELPGSPADLLDWMDANTQSVHTRYAAYLEERRNGAPRRFFANRAHALYVLRAIAPTKLVDGAWLYGLVAHWHNPRLAELVRTYVEELGEGAIDKNHVVLYRSLLARYALDPLDDLDDALYRQGLVQLALGWNAERFLPEVVGFNLGYEQLPLHLLITAYELNELGLDPYYFTLHVTVDNPDTGHARRACQAALDLLPRLDDGGQAWRRMRLGSQLASAGPGTTAVIEGFDIERELLHILRHKARTGSGAHSNYCKVAGRGVNDWLAAPDDLPAFLAALQAAGWIRRGEPPGHSRFWNLLQGERAEMFGVFSGYELQVVHDWIRGEASRDGQPFTEAAPADAPQRRRPTFRAAVRNGLVASVADDATGALLDPDLQAFQQLLQQAEGPAREALLVEAMSPASHWTPAGLEATRLFWAGATR
ncbi:MAG: iron-containing redox enzyme family protein [Ramlibacter sp.]